jgi:Flp pilus assembly protein TadG
MRGNQSATSSRRAARRRRRSGSVLIWSSLLLANLVAMTGLVIDGGLMLAAYREGQNAADAAALAAAMDLMLGKSKVQATATATTFVTDAAHNNLPYATVVVNIPPSNGAYAGLANYAEAIVTYPITTHFLQVLPGFNRNQSVTAQAVAGFEPITIDEGVIALNPTASPGLWDNGQGTIRVNGNVVVNATATNAATAGQGSIYAASINVVGGVDKPANFLNIDPSGPSPLQTGTMPFPDPFGNMPTPTTATGVDPTSRGSVKATNGDTLSLSPGVYSNIKITGGTVTFNPGIYVVAGGDLSVTGGAVTGNGVMFYMTGADYNPATGAPDASDPIDPLGLSPPTSPNNAFGTATINGAMQFSPIDTTNPSFSYSTSAISTFNGMLFYFRRADTAGMSIQGNSSAGSLTGTIYSKWGSLDIAGQGTYSAQFAVGSMKVTGNGNVTVASAGSNQGKVPRVFLVN